AGRWRAWWSLAELSEPGLATGNPAAPDSATGNRISLFRQRNELMFLRNRGKAAGFPVLLGLLDPLLAGGDEIPPDVARPFQRIAAEKHHPRGLQRLYRDAVAGAEDQEPRPLIAFARDLDLAVDDIDRTLLMIGVERHAGAGDSRNFGVEPGRHH